MQFRVIVVTDPQTHTQTHGQDQLQYTAPQLARSVITGSNGTEKWMDEWMAPSYKSYSDKEGHIRRHRAGCQYLIRYAAVFQLKCVVNFARVWVLLRLLKTTQKLTQLQNLPLSFHTQTPQQSLMAGQLVPYLCSHHVTKAPNVAGYALQFVQLQLSPLTASIILSSNKIQNGDILVLVYPGCPRK